MCAECHGPISNELAVGDFVVARAAIPCCFACMLAKERQLPTSEESALVLENLSDHVRVFEHTTTTSIRLRATRITHGVHPTMPLPGPGQKVSR